MGFSFHNPRTEMRYTLLALLLVSSLAYASPVTTPSGILNVTVIDLASQTTTVWSKCNGYANLSQFNDGSANVAGVNCTKTVADYMDPGELPAILPFQFVMLSEAKNPYPRWIGYECVFYGVVLESVPASIGVSSESITVVCAD